MRETKNFWNRKKVAVFGGSGFIGSHIVEELVRRDAIVTAVVRKKDDEHLENLRFVLYKIKVLEADLLDAKACEKAVAGQDIIINAAAVDGGSKFKAKYPFKIFHDNVLIALNILSALNEKVEQYIQISSAAIYYSSNVLESETKETADYAFPPVDASYAYSWSKIFTEIICRFHSQRFGTKILIIRPLNIFGPRDIIDDERIRLIPFLIREIKKGSTRIKLSGPGNRIVSFLFVKDFVDNLLNAIELQTKIFDVVNFGSEEEISLRELCYLIADLMNRKVDFVFDNDTFPPIRNVADLTKAKKEYGFKQYTSIREGLKRLLNLRP